MNSLHRLFNRETLLGRTALVLGIAFVVFALLTVVLVQYTLVRPHTREAADDLASFLVLAAQIWVELPPFTRPDYEREMLGRHDLQIRLSAAEQPQQAAPHGYLRHLEAALSAHLQQAIRIHQYPERPGWLWADLPMGGRVLRLGFRESRLQDHLILLLPTLTGLGLGAAFLLSIFLVGRVSRPLAGMVEAAHRMGEGDFSARVPERGPRELANLARKLNRMEGRIALLLDNRTTLLAGISHDLRTPLARMRLELEMLKGEGNAALVDDLKEDVTEMENLIRRTLLLARGLAHEPAQTTDIVSLIQAVTEGFQQAGHPVDLKTPTTCQHPIPGGVLRQILNNLIENAVSHGGGESVHVELDCGPARKDIEIRVIDRGPGIPADQREAIFEPFHRLDASRSRSTGGSGLGLAVVRQLCLAYGWEIRVDTADGQQGACFRVRLPGLIDTDRVAD